MHKKKGAIYEKNLLCRGGGRLLSSAQAFLEGCKKNKICYNSDILHHKYNGDCMKNRKFAFTLAEVLITLGIIGVVASLTIPALIANYRNMVLENQFKKSYSILSQALISTKEELGENLHQNYNLEPPGGAIEFRETYFKYLMKLSPGGYSQANNLGRDWKSFSGVKESTLLGLGAIPGYLLLADGTYITVEKNNSRLNILVDINGRKKPNRTGYDVFLFVVDTKQDKLVSWSDDKSYCDKTAKTASYNGRACTYFAMINENPDDKSKKYFQSLKW